MKSSSNHWNALYQETEDNQFGWYEADSESTFQLLNKVPGWKKTTLFLPGVGRSLLVDRLLDSGANLILNDLSSSALAALKERLGDDRSRSVEWICQNIAHPLSSAIPAVDVWIDRAVLHFLTEEDDIDGYFRNVSVKLKVGGHILFAEFPPHGAPKCAGLELHRYSDEELLGRLGPRFSLVDHFDQTHIGRLRRSTPLHLRALQASCLTHGRTLSVASSGEAFLHLSYLVLV